MNIQNITDLTDDILGEITDILVNNYYTDTFDMCISQINSIENEYVYQRWNHDRDPWKIAGVPPNIHINNYILKQNKNKINLD